LLLNINDLKKISTAYARMTRPAFPKVFRARPTSEFGEHLATMFVFNINNLLVLEVPAIKRMWIKWNLIIFPPSIRFCYLNTNEFKKDCNRLR